MITAASVAFGMKRNDSVRKPRESSIRVPVRTPPSVVRTPLALLMAVRVKDPVVGIDEKNDPQMLHNPNANISWVASTVFPLAGNQ